MLTIERLDAAGAAAIHDTLCEILRDSVDGGASVGFLPPLAPAEASAYWDGVIAGLAAGSRALLVARADGAMVGTVQLELPGKPNARHRAEVQKLLVHGAARRRGVGAALMAAVAELALGLGRTLLVLDTLAGDDGERLYRRVGYREAGRIPGYAIGADGGHYATVLFYRDLAGGGA
jgi:GNAT superfamily N-acetyltransferase